MPVTISMERNQNRIGSSQQVNIFSVPDTALSMDMLERELPGQANPAKTMLSPVLSFLVYKKDYFVMQPRTSVKDL